MNAGRSPRKSPADEWIERVLADREFAEAERDSVRRERQRALRKNLPILRKVLVDLRGVGYDVSLLSDLPELEDGDPAIPVLVGWLKSLDNEDVKADVARALTFRSRDPDLARVMITEFENARPGSYVQWDLGNAIGAMPQPELVDDLLRLSSNPDYGDARGQLVRALGRFRHNQAVAAALVELLSDRSVVVAAIESVGRLRVAEAVEPLRAWLDDDDEVVREQAREALAKISRG